MARQLRRIGAVAVILWVTCMSGSPARAFEDGRNDPAPVASDGVSVRVDIRRVGGENLVAGVSVEGGGGGGTDPGCTFHVEEIATAAEALDILGPPPSPDAVPYRLFCGSAPWGGRWVVPNIVDYDQIARTEAERYVRDILAPGLQLHHAPNTYAVTGAPSHHWVTGWDGAPIAVPPINPYGDQLDITLTLASVTWDHGDNTGTTTGDLGTPAPSSVQHTYTHRSTTTDPNGTYTVTATTTINIAYALNGGPPITVNPPLTTTLTAPIVVRELQAVLG